MMFKSLMIKVGFAGLGWAIAATFPQFLQAEPAQPLFSPKQEEELITTVSQQMATNLQTKSCQEFSALLSAAQASQTQTSDHTSIVDQAIDQLLTSVRTKPELRSILVSNLGPPLVNKLIDCRMVPIHAFGDAVDLLPSIESKNLQPERSSR